MPVVVGAKGSHSEVCPASKPWPIVEKATGKVKGCSASRAMAQSSCNARNGAQKGWVPSGKPRRR